MGTGKGGRSERSQQVHVFQNKGAHAEDAPQRMFWLKLNPGHGSTGMQAASSQGNISES